MFEMILKYINEFKITLGQLYKLEGGSYSYGAVPSVMTSGLKSAYCSVCNNDPETLLPYLNGIIQDINVKDNGRHEVRSAMSLADFERILQLA